MKHICTDGENLLNGDGYVMEQRCENGVITVSIKWISEDNMG